MVGSRSGIGFIGLGVMGMPMCRHLASKSGQTVTGYDLSDAPFSQLGDAGVHRSQSIADLVLCTDTIFVSLPSGAHLEAVCRGPEGVLAHVSQGQIFVDLGTSPVGLTQALAEEFAAKGVRYADAPVARTRAAAEQGTLALTVGGARDLFDTIEPLLRCFAEEVTHCGPVGTGQAVKILNNMVVVGTVIALSEAAAIARGTGINVTALFETFAKGSADSFALRNHGFKAVAPASFPERVFSTDYMLKDISYALAMAADAGVEVPGADYAASLLGRASSEGHGSAYWPVASTLYRTSR